MDYIGCPSDALSFSLITFLAYRLNDFYVNFSLARNSQMEGEKSIEVYLYTYLYIMYSSIKNRAEAFTTNQQGCDFVIMYEK